MANNPYQYGIDQLRAQQPQQAPQLTTDQQQKQVQAGTAQSNLSNYFQQNQNPGTVAANYSPYLNDPSTLAQVQPYTYGGAQVGQAAQYGGAQLGRASTLDPRQVQGITQSNTPNLSADSTIQQLLAAFAPQRTAAQGALNDQLANAGLVGGPAVAAQQNLESRLTAALAPQLAAAIQQSQSNQLNAGQFNSNALLQALGANQSAQNQYGLQQGQFNQQAGLANQSAQNANQLSNAQFQQQAGLAGMDARNNAQSANVGAANALNTSNTAQRNQSQQNLLNALQQQYMAQLSSFNSLNGAALGAQNNIAVNSAQNYGVPAAGDSSLSSQLAALYAPRYQSGYSGGGSAAPQGG